MTSAAVSSARPMQGEMMMPSFRYMSMQNATTITPVIITSSMPSFLKYHDTDIVFRALLPMRRRMADTVNRIMSPTVKKMTKTAIITRPMKPFTSPSMVHCQSSPVASATFTLVAASSAIPKNFTMGFSGMPMNSFGSGPCGWYRASMSTPSAMTGASMPKTKRKRNATQRARTTNTILSRPICFTTVLQQPVLASRSLVRMPSDATVEPMQKRLKQVKPMSRSIRACSSIGWCMPRTR
mmetsp:Transcript_4889/g.12588  ORF Transcript_4889/g.12588 Transcript_4889/m.12588 type:complete len:239 (-) Transcript_4889:666-1382(-)